MEIDRQRTRDFALQVVTRLRRHGYQAVWAGGCVRDELLGKTPKDYDVATSARPDEVRKVFGRRRTIPVGAAFGVITVVGPPGAGQVDVATFREEAGYSDGRHPDHVAFSSPEQDALRRDFTVNGLFYDPIEDRVLDFVGGEADLRAGVIRAIGDPEQRISEDKLRMLRAIRFATVFEFRVDPETLRAIQRHAGQIRVVSAERIAGEMRLILADLRRGRGVVLLRESGLLEHLLPEIRLDDPTANQRWHVTLRMLHALGKAEFPTALAALLRSWCSPDEATAVAQRWKLANREIRAIRHLITCEPRIHQAHEGPWHAVQPLLIDPLAASLVQFALASARAQGTSSAGAAYCLEKLRLPHEQLDPAPLVTGDDLLAHSIPPGPRLGQILRQVRNAQLDGQIQSRDDALRLAQSLSQSDHSD